MWSTGGGRRSPEPYWPADVPQDKHKKLLYTYTTGNNGQLHVYSVNQGGVVKGLQSKANFIFMVSVWKYNQPKQASFLTRLTLRPSKAAMKIIDKLKEKKKSEKGVQTRCFTMGWLKQSIYQSINQSTFIFSNTESHRKGLLNGLLHNQRNRNWHLIERVCEREDREGVETQS